MIPKNYMPDLQLLAVADLLFVKNSNDRHQLLSVEIISEK